MNDAFRACWTCLRSAYVRNGTKCNRAPVWKILFSSKESLSPKLNLGIALYELRWYTASIRVKSKAEDNSLTIFMFILKAWHWKVRRRYIVDRACPGERKRRAFRPGWGSGSWGSRVVLPRKSCWITVHDISRIRQFFGLWQVDWWAECYTALAFYPGPKSATGTATLQQGRSR